MKSRYKMREIFEWHAVARAWVVIRSPTKHVTCGDMIFSGPPHLLKTALKSNANAEANLDPAVLSSAQESMVLGVAWTEWRPCGQVPV